MEEIFEKNTFHHIPVVQLNKPVGIIDRFNFESYKLGLRQSYEAELVRERLLKLQKVSSIMSSKFGRVDPTDTLSIAIEVFRQNVVEALMVISNGEVVGILTSYSIILAISKEKISDLDCKSVEDVMK